MIVAIAALLFQIPAIPQEVTARLADATVNVTDSAGTAPESTSAPAIPPPGAVGLNAALNPDLMASRERLEKLRRRDWLALTVVEHSAATFDAWSTRRAISRGAYETDPLMRPFSRNASIYAAIQVGPLLLDYVSKRMMTSRHDWLRHTWWIPQVVSTTAFFVSGTHNLSIFSARSQSPSSRVP
jgi:hypothetical protein